MSQARTQMISFEVNGQAMAVAASALSGVATDCPFLSYPGLPPGVAGILQWSGKIFPVIAPFGGDGVFDPSTQSFLIATRPTPGLGPVAWAVPGRVRVFTAQQSRAAELKPGQPGVIRAVVDSTGQEALEISLEVLEQSLSRGKAEEHDAA